MAIATGTVLRRVWIGALLVLGMSGMLGAAEIAALTEASHDRPARRIVISIADRKLAVFEGVELKRTWDVAVGKPSSPSPVGEFRIATRVKNPTWYGPRGPVAPGPANPVGTRWIGLSLKGYGIHGTNAPKSIGTAASKGCIRMHRDDVEELFSLIAEGDAAELVQEPEGTLAQAFRPAPPPALAQPTQPQLTAMHLPSAASLPDGRKEMVAKR